MSGMNQRIVFDIMLRSGQNRYAINQARATYCRISGFFNRRSALPNLDGICKCCQKIDSQLGAYISNMCPDFEGKETFLDTNNPQLAHLFDNIDTNRKKKIRILLYPGDRNTIAELKIPDATHTMILQFSESSASFMATEPHANPPSFYQMSKSENMAILYIEALLVDACMCHYLAISDAAYHHDDKQRISRDKVDFIREIAKKDMNFLSPCAQSLVKYVAEQLQDDTPYISFLSIFTVASLDALGKAISAGQYFKDYCALWVEFQKWYFGKYHRVFSKENYSNVIGRLLDRNVYQGQISPVASENEMKECVVKHNFSQKEKRLGWKNLYAFVILKHMPKKANTKAIFDSFFPNELHQATFCIKKWEQVIYRNDLWPKVELLPFVVSNSQE